MWGCIGVRVWLLQWGWRVVVDWGEGVVVAVGLVWWWIGVGVWGCSGVGVWWWGGGLGWGCGCCSGVGVGWGCRGVVGLGCGGGVGWRCGG